MTLFFFFNPEVSPEARKDEIRKKMRLPHWKLFLFVLARKKLKRMIKNKMKIFL